MYLSRLYFTMNSHKKEYFFIKSLKKDVINSNNSTLSLFKFRKINNIKPKRTKK
jgi:hypothetical protein